MSNDYDRNRNQYSGNAGNYGRRNQRDDDNNWWERTKDKVSSWFSDDDNDRDRSRDYGGGHRGKGPADYRRSQDRIREDICDRLTDDDRVDASNIRVQIDDDAVILSGTVSSREEKRRAEDLVESISGVRNVENRLRVGGNALSSREYTGNTDDISGIGRESGTTNEIIRNASNERTSVTEKGRTKIS
jgi:osmotically-inducible protein OsmY